MTLATWLFPAPGRPLSMMTICGHSPLIWGGRDRGGRDRGGRDRGGRDRGGGDRGLRDRGGRDRERGREE